MKNMYFPKILLLLFFFISCKQNDESNCIVQEWKVIDVYRKNYPSLIDTACDGNFVLFNKSKVPKSILDSVFSKNRKSNFFSFDSLGVYEITEKAIVDYGAVKYLVTKVVYLSKGYNIDQAIFLWMVKNKGIYIQQENDHKKLFLLKGISNKNGNTESTEELVYRIMDDTILFQKPPPMSDNQR